MKKYILGKRETNRETLEIPKHTMRLFFFNEMPNLESINECNSKGCHCCTFHSNMQLSVLQLTFPVHFSFTLCAPLKHMMSSCQVIPYVVSSHHSHVDVNWLRKFMREKVGERELYQQWTLRYMVEMQMLANSSSNNIHKKM